MSGLDGLGWPAQGGEATAIDDVSAGCARTHSSAGVRQRGNLYWIIQALRPNIEIRITKDWQPKYRLWRYLRKGSCEICGRRFREKDEGTISKRETLCGTHCMMTTQEIADHHRRNDELRGRPERSLTPWNTRNQS